MRWKPWRTLKPTSEWCADPKDKPPVDANWQTTNSQIRHTFTHFHLEVIVKFANVPLDCQPKQGVFLEENDFDLTSLPTLFQKAYKLGYLLK